MSLALVAVAAGLSLGVAWQQSPRPPALDGERWFKVSLATLLRGEIEANGGGVEAWEEAVLRWVPYHPVGRFPERKISNPVAAGLPEQALPGEIALLESLAALDGAEARWARLYDLDEVAIEARLSDPAGLGPDYDPEATLGPPATWSSLAAWGAGDPEFAQSLHRVAGATWVLIEGRQGRVAGFSLLDDFADELGDDSVVRVPWAGGEPGELDSVLHELARGGTNLVMVAEEAGVARLLSVMADNVAIRDRTYAVLALGGVIGGRSDEEGPYGRAARDDWMKGRFTQGAFETEVVRLTPYFSLQWLDRGTWPPGVEGMSLESARFPEPDGRDATAVTLEVVDLGPLPVVSDLPLRQVVRALMTVVASWRVHRR